MDDNKGRRDKDSDKRPRRPRKPRREQEAQPTSTPLAGLPHGPYPSTSAPSKQGGNSRRARHYNHMSDVGDQDQHLASAAPHGMQDLQLGAYDEDFAMDLQATQPYGATLTLPQAIAPRTRLPPDSFALQNYKNQLPHQDPWNPYHLASQTQSPGSAPPINPTSGKDVFGRSSHRRKAERLGGSLSRPNERHPSPREQESSRMIVRSQSTTHSRVADVINQLEPIKRVLEEHWGEDGMIPMRAPSYIKVEKRDARWNPGAAFENTGGSYLGPYQDGYDGHSDMDVEPATSSPDEDGGDEDALGERYRQDCY